MDSHIHHQSNDLPMGNARTLEIGNQTGGEGAATEHQAPFGGARVTESESIMELRIPSPPAIILVPALQLQEGQVLIEHGLVWLIERIEGVVDGRLILRANCGSLLGIPVSRSVQVAEMERSIA